MIRPSATQTLRGGVALSHPENNPGNPARLLPGRGESALLVVDCQGAFTDPSSRTAVSGVSEAVSVILELARSFSAAGRPVVATRHAHAARPGPGGMGSWWRSFVMEGTPAAALDPRLDPSLIDAVMVKQTYSAFRSTRLFEWLRERAVESIVICGFQTHMCVESSAREAFDAGFDVVIVPEACGSADPALHSASVACMRHALARIASVREVADWLAGP